MPTLADVFGQNKPLLKAIRKAGFKSVAPLMLIPQESLRSYEGIGSRSALQITRCLRHFELGHHVIYRPVQKFINDEFGCIEDAPIGVLHVTIVRKQRSNHPEFAPLELVSLLDDFEPQMQVMDILNTSPDQLRKTVQQKAAFGIEIEDIEEDIKHLDIRLRNYGLRLRTPESAESDFMSV